MNAIEVSWHNAIEEADYMTVRCVYFLRAANGMVKVGETVDLERRLKSHRRNWIGEYAFELIGFLETPNHRYLEERIHLWLWFQKKRKSTRGYWFSMTADDLVEIKAALGVHRES